MLNITDVTQPGRSGRLHHQTDDSRKQTQGPQTSHHFSSICLCSHSYLPTRGSKVQIIGLGTINISWAPNPVLSIKTTKIYFEDKKKKFRRSCHCHPGMSNSLYIMGNTQPTLISTGPNQFTTHSNPETSPYQKKKKCTFNRMSQFFYMTKKYCCSKSRKPVSRPCTCISYI